jgi:hypothetical protein
MTKKSSDRYIDPESFLVDAVRKEGSWWTEWVSWIADKSGASVKPPSMGAPAAGDSPLCDAPGTYVYQGLGRVRCELLYGARAGEFRIHFDFGIPFCCAHDATDKPLSSGSAGGSARLGRTAPAQCILARANHIPENQLRQINVMRSGRR